VAAGGRQKRYRLLNRHAPADFLGKRGPARRTLGFLPFLDRAGSQLGEAAALLPAEEVPIAALLYVVGRLVQAYVALQVVRDVLVLAPPGGDRGGVGGGAHGTMEGAGHLRTVRRKEWGPLWPENPRSEGEIFIG
jgi:hypothetical protein